MIKGFTLAFLAPVNTLGQLIADRDNRNATQYTPDWVKATQIRVKHDDDETVIPVTVRLKNGSCQRFEDGILMWCTHTGENFEIEKACCPLDSFLDCGCGGQDIKVCLDCNTDVEEDA